jgi:hypothetical protein
MLDKFRCPGIHEWVLTQSARGHTGERRRNHFAFLNVQSQAEVIAGRVYQVLTYSQVPLCGLDRGVSQAQLNLFERGMATMRELGERAP